ncbi:uncharacterized protein LOC128740795 [Sabethes cyaneus]|uniref:uncharacterized protein LOC128740795 n=1 Tax=Sabethes cyaneus TaxID=53552 RepID=UPI00237E61BF|nr:uncharacterized protein LOC128740795 [Sabethes cyaneus]
MYTSYTHWTDWYAVMDSLSISGIGLQTIIKLHVALVKTSYFKEKYFDLKALHQRSSKNPQNNLAMEKSLIFPLELPFVDTFSDTGYVILTVYHGVLLVMGVPGILAADMTIMIYVLHILGIVDVFINNLDELDEMLVQVDTSETAKQQKFTEICVMHREIIRYEQDLDECYFFVVFIQVISSVSCLSLTLFVVYMTKRWARVLFIFATFFQLLEFCLLGTALRLKWHLLALSDKRRLIVMLHRAQNPVEMTIEGLYMLNMETFVEIMKTIYSYFTMMISFLE